MFKAIVVRVAAVLLIVLPLPAAAESVAAPDRLTANLTRNVYGCRLPPAGTDDIVTLLGVYEGATASTVSVAGPDEPTDTIAIRIEDGEEPIYAMLVAHAPMVWRFEGATERLSHVAVIGRSSEHGIAAGVTGIEADKVGFHSGETCLSYFSKPGRGQDRAVEAAMRTLGRPADVVLGVYDPAEVTLPSGAILDGYAAVPVGLDPGWPAAQLRDILRFKPGGLLDIPAGKVVSPVPVEPYLILPQEFGLAQIVADGIAVRESRQTYRIVEPLVRFPAGLAGAHSVTFVLSQGLAMPAGDPLHSGIIIDTRVAPGNPIVAVETPLAGPNRLDFADGTHLVYLGPRPHSDIRVCGPFAAVAASRLKVALNAFAPGVFIVEPVAELAKPFGSTVVYVGTGNPEEEGCARGPSSHFRIWTERRAADVPSSNCVFSRLHEQARMPFYDYAAAYLGADTLDRCFDSFVLTLLGLAGDSAAPTSADDPRMDEISTFLLSRYREP
jgi:hypothetical protein